MLFGGAGNDTIFGNEGDDVILGDFGYFDINLPLHLQILPLAIFEISVPCNDVIYGEEGDDIIFRLQGNNTIYGGPG